MQESLLKTEIKHISEQIKSKERVRDHGEVFTSEREVKRMIELLGDEAYRIESRILEPACGTGNFFIQFLEHKLATVEKLYHNDPKYYALYSLIAVGALYGIDIQKDNIEECHARLKKITLDHYGRQERTEINLKNYIIVLDDILRHNIIWGDTLKMCTPPHLNNLITFSEWTIENDKIKKRIFKYSEIDTQEDLFNPTTKEYNLSSEPILALNEPALSIDEMAKMITENKTLTHDRR